MKPAFYALRPGGWRDYVTLLHPPFTLWHVSYVVVGGTLAPHVPWGRLALAALAFALATGVGSHTLDELHGRPLRTEIPTSVLISLAVTSLAAAGAIGITVAASTTLWLLAFVVAGALFVPVYTLELFGGRLHTDLSFALSWGAFPVVTGYVASSGHVRAEALFAAAWATTLSLAQRKLSTAARRVRRQVTGITGRLELRDGGSEPVTRESLIAAPEAALALLGLSTVFIAAALVVVRL